MRSRLLRVAAALVFAAAVAAVTVPLSSPAASAQEPPQDENVQRQTSKPTAPGTPTVTRKQQTSASAPALSVSWTAPSSGAFTGWYEAQYRKQGAAGWTSYSGVLRHNNTSLTLTSLEDGATYEVQVRACHTFCNDEGRGPWSGTGSGRANRAPTATSAAFNGGTFPVGSTADYRETGQGALGVFFADADSDTLTYSAAAQHPALLGVSLSGAAGQAHLRVTLLNQGSSKVNITATDAYGGSVTRSVTITVTAKTSRSVAENSAAGTNVGAPVTGTPYDDGDDETDDALTYTLHGKAADSGLFVIDSASGQISVAQGATLDYETDDAHRETETSNGEVIAKFYRGEVRYTVDGHNAAISVTIKVTDVAPGKPGAPTVTRTAFSEPSDPALDVSWTAAAANGTTITGYEAQYRKQAAQGEEAADWTAYSGTLGATATSLTLADLEAGATYEVQVRAVSSDESAGAWSNTGSGRANRPPAATSASFLGGTFTVGSIADYDESNPLVGAFFEDADGDTLTYSAAAQYPGLLGVSLSGASGGALLRVTLLNPGASGVTYTAADAYGGSVTRTVTLTGTANERRSVAENSAAGTAVGAPVTGIPYDDGDEETDDTLSYSLTGEASTSGPFVIDSASGQISVAQDASLDYETKASYAGQVRYTVGGREAVVNLTIEVMDQPAPPAAPTVTRTRFSEPANPALDVSWTAPSNPGDTITGYEAQYRKSGDTTWTAYSGTLDATTTSLTLPNLEAGATYEVQVRTLGQSEGAGPWSDTGSGRANRPPAATSAPFNGGTFSVGTIADYRETGQGALGVLFSDADGDTLTYAASAQHPALLGVSLSGAAGAAHLQVTLLNQGASKVNYVASDPYGGALTRSVTITVTAKTSRSIAENAAAGTNVGAPVTGTPYDDGDDQTDDALTYTLQGKAAESGLFVIDSASGQISVAEGATLDYEAADGSYRETETFNGQVIAKFYRGEVHYTVDGHAAVINVNIKLTDLEAGQPGTPGVTRTPSSVPMNPALDVSWTAAAANGTTLSGYEAQYRVKAAQGEEPAAWTAYTGTISATATSVTLPDLDAGATYEVQVRAVTSDEGPGPWSGTGSGRANRPPKRRTPGTLNPSWLLEWGGDDSVRSISGNFADDDGDTLTYAASAAYPGVFRVGIEGASPDQMRIHVLNPATSRVTYGAHDGFGGYVSEFADVSGFANVTRSIAENSGAGWAVGDPVTGTPYDDGNDETDDALTYSLTGDVATAFVIDSPSGQIRVKQGASIDYETKTS
ncbi:MAG: fibronectin type III domain-containing protein, partial [Chloroflexota bacterium]|nr:fibronectin type III domain-containing protein [Chloroflexota bacterium]